MRDSRPHGIIVKRKLTKDPVNVKELLRIINYNIKFTSDATLMYSIYSFFRFRFL